MNPLDPYALYMVGRSMSPRYEPGWLLHINPGRPPISGRDIVIYKRNSEVPDQAVRRANLDRPCPKTAQPRRDAALTTVGCG